MSCYAMYVVSVSHNSLQLRCVMLGVSSLTPKSSSAGRRRGADERPKSSNETNETVTFHEFYLIPGCLVVNSTTEVNNSMKP